MVTANRGGGKTNVLGILESTEAEFKRVGTAHVAATLNQSDKLRDYTRDYFDVRTGLASGDKERNIRLHNGGRIEILAATLAGVNGPHYPHLSVDEFDEITKAIFLQSLGIALATAEYPYSAARVLSTWKHAVGPMTEMLDKAEEKGFRIWRWCIFETLQQCTKPDCADCHDVVCYDRRGVAHTWAAVCDGRARRSRGYMLLDDHINNKFRAMSGDFETYESEHLCTKPETLGQYYAPYRAEIHEIAPGNPMGWKPRPEYGHYVWVDPGVNSQNAIVIAQPVPTGAGEFDLVIVDSLADRDGDTLLQTWPKVRRMQAPYGMLHAGHGDCYGYNRQNARKSTPVFSLLEEEYGISIVPCPKKLMGYETRSGAVSERLEIKSDGYPRMRVWTGTPGGKAVSQAFQAVRKKEIGGIPMSDEPDLGKQESKLAFNRTSACEYGIVLIDICGQG